MSDRRGVFLEQEQWNKVLDALGSQMDEWWETGRSYPDARELSEKADQVQDIVDDINGQLKTDDEPSVPPVDRKVRRRTRRKRSANVRVRHRRNDS